LLLPHLPLLLLHIADAHSLHYICTTLLLGLVMLVLLF
jgi:hypothetical protein